MLKKWWFYVLVLIGILISIVLIRYKSMGKVDRIGSLLHLIPKNANTVVVLDNDRIFSSIERELLTNPSLIGEFFTLFESEDSVEGPDFNGLFQSCKLGYRDSVLLFRDPNYLHFAAGIGRPENLNAILADSLAHLGFQKLQDNPTAYHSQKEGVWVTWQEKRIVLSFELEQDSLTQAPYHLFTPKTNYWPFADSLLIEQVNKENDLFFWSSKTKGPGYSPNKIKDYMAAVNFRQGGVNISGNYRLKDPKNIANTDIKSSTKDSSAVLSVSLNLAEIREMGWNLDSTMLYTMDSILALNGFRAEDLDFLFRAQCQFSFNGYDSIVSKYTTYDYDDDFNKIAIEHSKTTVYPIISLSIKTNEAKSFIEKLSDRGFIGTKKGRTTFNAPLDYSIYLNETAWGFHLTTQLTKQEVFPEIQSPVHLVLDFNTLESSPTLDIPFQMPNIFASLKVDSNIDQKGVHQLNASLHFDNAQKHGLITLLQYALQRNKSEP